MSECHGHIVVNITVDAVGREEAPLEDMKLMLPLWIQFQGWIMAPRLDAHPRRYDGSLLLCEQMCEQKQFDRVNESQYLQVPCSETSVSPLSVTNLRKTL